MRTLVILTSLVVFISCGQGSDQQKTLSAKDSQDHIADAVLTDTTTSPVKTVIPAPAPTREEFAVNASLQNQYGNKYHVLNDQTATWMKDAFDYFIAPKRKQLPNYPYIATGDFDVDGTTDTAAVITDSLKSTYQVAFLMGNRKIIFWEEDIIEDAAIKTLSKPGPIQGMDEKNIEKTRTIRPKGDVLEVEYFERAAFVLYWDKKSFRRIRTAD